MTMYTCDKCGRKIDIGTNMAVMPVKCFKVTADRIKQVPGRSLPEYQLCVDCAMKVHRFITQREG